LTVIQVWARVDAEDAAFRGDELRSLGLLEPLTAAGVITKGEDLSEVECDACGDDHVEPVVWITEPPGSEPRAYIWCPVAGCIRVSIERLEIWRVVFDGLVKAVARTLGMRDSLRVLIDDRLWLLGTTSLGGLPKDVFFVRGSAWPNGGSQLSADARLATAVRPVILVPHRIPDDPVWKSNGLIILSMSEFHWFGGHQDVIRAITDRVAAHEPGIALTNGAQFRRDGPVWSLRFDGKSVQVDDLVGMEYIAELLRHPRTPIEADTLVAAFRQSADGAVEVAEERIVGAAAATPGIPMTDAKAVKMVKAELAERKSELRGSSAVDETIRTNLEREISQLQDYLAQVKGRDGRSRTTGGVAARSRSRAKHAIDRAMAKIAQQHLALANHLQDSIRTGNSLVYMPTEVPDWQF
jgi:hypothetical protein